MVIGWVGADIVEGSIMTVLYPFTVTGSVGPASAEGDAVTVTVAMLAGEIVIVVTCPPSETV